MKIDRAAFLSITAALAATVACEESVPPARTPPPLPEAPIAIAPAPAPEPPPAPAPAPAPDPAPPIAPEPPPLPALGKEDDCYGNVTTFDPTKAPASCGDETKGTISCAIPPYPPVEGGARSSDIADSCKALTAKLKPKAAAAAAACMRKEAARWAKGQGDQFCEQTRCATAALFASCPDPTTDAACQSIAASCSNVEATRCRAWLSGMSQKGRDTVVACVKQHCKDGFGYCFAASEGM